MPGPDPVVGVEFLFCSISNGDGTLLEVFVTLTDAQHHFSIRALNGSDQDCKMRITRTNGTVVNVNLPPGESTFDAGNRVWEEWKDTSISSAPRKN